MRSLWSMEWLKLSIWIGTYGFLKEFRPEDPYIAQYLTQAPMNFTEPEVYQEIYPLATYVSLSQLIVVFLLTDWLRYKPVILVHALSAVMMQVILIWCRSKFAMYIMEVCYGTMTACEIAYYTYIYAKVDKKHYQIVTSHMRGASLTGRFTSAVTSQIALFFGMTIADLNYFTLAGMSFGFLWALTLPSVRSSIYFHRSNSVPDFNDCTKAEAVQPDITCVNGKYLEQEQLPVLRKVCSKSVVFQRLWSDFKHAYTNLYVLKWSLWWAIATCGYNQIMTYVQILWELVKKEEESSTEYNGSVEAIYTLLSASAAFCFGYLKVDWKVYGEIFLGFCTLAEGIIILWSSTVGSVMHAYLAYISFGILYHVMMTVSNSEVARNIRSDSYALIFGFNTFIAILLQTILTMVVNDKNSLLKFAPRDQYRVFGGYFITLGIVFCLKAVWTKISSRFRSHS